MKQIISVFLGFILSVSTVHASTDFLSLPDLELGSKNSAVKILQQFLNTNGYTVNPVVGEEGSKGYEGTYFGLLTQKALSLFQKDNSISPASGYFGPKTKKYIDGLSQNIVADAKKNKLSSSTLNYPSCTSATKDGVTWYFNARPCGTYVNGDWWVVGPVTITSISPQPTNGTNGSMLNPTIGNNQGFTNKGTYNSSGADPFYKSNLNVGLNLPLTINSNNSLVSSITNTNWNYPMDMYAILTVVESAPADGSFRPSPIGSGSRASLWNESQLDYSKLGNYSRAQLSATPDINAYISYFSHAWFEYNPNWTGGYARTSYMAPNGYGRDLAYRTGDAALLLNLDFTNEQKRNLLIGVVQAGLDNYGFIQKGGAWYNDGGHNLGRLSPVLIAAGVLNDSNLKSVIRGSSLKFQEFQNTFIVSSADTGKFQGTWQDCDNNSATPKVLAGTNCDPIVKYTESDIGEAEWGIRHTGNPELDNNYWAASYRDINGSNFTAPTLVAEIMGLRSTINWEPLFLYAKRHLTYETSSSYKGEFGYNPTPLFHKQFYALYHGGTVPSSGGNNGQPPATPTTPPPSTNTSLQKPTITYPTGSTVSSTNSITFTWTGEGTQFLTRFVEVTSSGSPVGTVSMDNNVTTTSATYNVTPGKYYTFWVHTGTLSSYSEKDEVIFQVLDSTLPTYTLTASKKGTGTGVINGISQAVTTLDEGTDITLTAQAGDNSTFEGWSGDCFGKGSCVLKMNKNKTINATFDSTLTPLFKNGDKIKVKANINVRSSAALLGNENLTGTHNADETGTIVSTHTIADGVVWYTVDYESGIDGWSGQDNLLLVESSQNINSNKGSGGSSGGGGGGGSGGGGGGSSTKTPATSKSTLQATCLISNTKVGPDSFVSLDTTIKNTTGTYTIKWSGISSKLVGFDKTKEDQVFGVGKTKGLYSIGFEVRDSEGNKTRAKCPTLKVDKKYKTESNSGSTTTSETNNKTVLTKKLSVGQTDEQVKILQKILNSKGYIISTKGVGSPGNESTYFGEITKQVVKKFQQANKLTVTGIVDEATMKLLNK